MSTLNWRTRLSASAWLLVLALIASACGAATSRQTSETGEEPAAAPQNEVAAKPTAVVGGDALNSNPLAAPTVASASSSGDAAPPAQVVNGNAPGGLPGGDAGRIAFMGPYGQELQVFVINADGTGLTMLTQDTEGSAFPSLSPDGKQVAYVSSRTGNPEVYLQEVGADSSAAVQLTNSPGLDNQPVFSPDGSQIAFISDRDGDLDIWIMNVDGSDPKLIVGRKGDDILGAWSPDGKSLVFVKQASQTQNIWSVDLDGGEPVQLTEPKGIDAAPVYSPDGSRIAFYSNRANGKLNIFTMATDGSDVQQLTSGNLDSLLPVYSPDGKWLAYGTAEGQALSLAVIPAEGGQPTVLNNELQGLPTSWVPTAERLADTGFTQGPANAGVEINAAVLEGAPTRGNPDAPVTIVEFSDYQCPFCKRHFDQTAPALEKYIEDGTVRVIWVDMPLSFHPQAPAAARAAYCAREQGGEEAYWQMHDALFLSQERWSGQNAPDSIFAELAGDQGLDSEALTACLSENKYADVVDAGVTEGSRLQISGTPTFFINGARLVGAQPIESFEQAIQTALQTGASQ